MKLHRLPVLLALAASALAAPAPQRPEDTPHVDLTNGDVSATVLLPDARAGYYRATRFDWSGLVARVRAGGHTFYAPWKRTHDPENFEDAIGPVDEFGTAGPDEKSGPLGFVTARPGERFVKIGVGVLEKPDDQPYQFFRTYRIIRPGAWHVAHGRDWVEFTQELSEGGWGYRYTKRIALSQRGFTLSRRLRNTGTRPITTDEYDHNFTIIDDDPVGPDYRVHFPFAAAGKQSMHGLAEVSGHEILFRKPLRETAGSGDQVYTEVTGFAATAADNEFTIENTRTGASVRVRGDRPLARLALWAIRAPLSIEPFIDIDLEPGAEFTWRITYDFYSEFQK